MDERAKRNGSLMIVPVIDRFYTEDHLTHNVYDEGGLTKRELFAAMAMSLGEGVWPGGHLPENADALAKNCVAVADALLAALADGTGEGK